MFVDILSDYWFNISFSINPLQKNKLKNFDIFEEKLLIIFRLKNLSPGKKSKNSSLTLQ